MLHTDNLSHHLVTCVYMQHATSPADQLYRYRTYTLRLGPVKSSLDYLRWRLVPVLAVQHDEAALRVAREDAAASHADYRLEWDVEAEVFIKAELHLLRVRLHVHGMACAWHVRGA